MAQDEGLWNLTDEVLVYALQRLSSRDLVHFLSSCSKAKAFVHRHDTELWYPLVTQDYEVSQGLHSLVGTSTTWRQLYVSRRNLRIAHGAFPGTFYSECTAPAASWENKPPAMRGCLLPEFNEEVQDGDSLRCGQNSKHTLPPINNCVKMAFDTWRAQSGEPSSGCLENRDMVEVEDVQSGQEASTGREGGGSCLAPAGPLTSHEELCLSEKGDLLPGGTLTPAPHVGKEDRGPPRGVIWEGIALDDPENPVAVVGDYVVVADHKVPHLEVHQLGAYIDDIPEVFKLEGHVSGVRAIAGDADHLRVVTLGWDHLVVVWDLKRRCEERRWALNTGLGGYGYGRYLAIHGSRVLCAQARKVTIWDLSTGLVDDSVTSQDHRLPLPLRLKYVKAVAMWGDRVVLAAEENTSFTYWVYDLMVRRFSYGIRQDIMHEIISQAVPIRHDMLNMTAADELRVSMILRGNLLVAKRPIGVGYDVYNVEDAARIAYVDNQKCSTSSDCFCSIKLSRDETELLCCSDRGGLVVFDLAGRRRLRRRFLRVVRGPEEPVRRWERGLWLYAR